jgi:hypothetical protein
VIFSLFCSPDKPAWQLPYARPAFLHQTKPPQFGSFGYDLIKTGAQGQAHIDRPTRHNTCKAFHNRPKLLILILWQIDLILM